MLCPSENVVGLPNAPHISPNPASPIDCLAQILQGSLSQYCMERSASARNRDSLSPLAKKLRGSPISPKKELKSSHANRFFSTNKL
jgi:hypothetical protein